jgi:hypothetical protein
MPDRRFAWKATLRSAILRGRASDLFDLPDWVRFVMMQRERGCSFARGLSLVSLVAALSLAASATPATASVTIGQVAPGSSPTAYCDFTAPIDVLQPTVTAGNGYGVPSFPSIRSLTITSWSTNASADVGQVLTFKVFRLVSGTTYSVVGHDRPRPITPSTVNTFSGLSIPVQPGDVIGLQHSGVNAACIFEAGPAEVHLERPGDLADGESGSFVSDNQRVNATALVGPSNSFAISTVKRNKNKGTATIAVTLPNPGELTGSGKGVQASSARAVTGRSVAAGPAQLLIKAKGKKRKTLNETGKVKLTVAITYTPTGGSPSTQSVKVKLKKKI